MTRYDPSDLVQHWNNGTEYIFLESNDDADKLASFLKTNEADGVETQYISFFRTITDAMSQNIKSHRD